MSSLKGSIPFFATRALTCGSEFQYGRGEAFSSKFGEDYFWILRESFSYMNLCDTSCAYSANSKTIVDSTINFEVALQASSDLGIEIQSTINLDICAPSEDESTINLLSLKSLMWPMCTRLVTFVSSLWPAKPLMSSMSSWWATRPSSWLLCSNVNATINSDENAGAPWNDWNAPDEILNEPFEYSIVFDTTTNLNVAKTDQQSRQRIRYCSRRMQQPTEMWKKTGQRRIKLCRNRIGITKNGQSDMAKVIWDPLCFTLFISIWHCHKSINILFKTDATCLA